MGQCNTNMCYSPSVHTLVSCGNYQLCRYHKVFPRTLLILVILVFLFHRTLVILVFLFPRSRLIFCSCIRRSVLLSIVLTVILTRSAILQYCYHYKFHPIFMCWGLSYCTERYLARIKCLSVRPSYQNSRK